MHHLLDLKKLDIEDQSAVGRDAGHGPAAVGQVGGDGQATLTADLHTGNTDIPALDDLALAELECERRALLVGVEDLAVLELADVAHADLVATLGGAASADLPVVNGYTLNDLDTTLGLLSLLGGRAGRALLEVLGELDLLISLSSGSLGLLSSDSLALVVLEFLLLLLAELLVVLSNELLEALGLLLSGTLLALLGLDQLGGLLLIRVVDLLDAGSAVDIVKLIALLVALILIGRKIIVLVILIILVRLLVIGNDIVAG